ncbi:MAG: NAD(+) synthase, partial [Clostridia bacterium]|nr:NAD(+) synthase [Clostridia bacterium]
LGSPANIVEKAPSAGLYQGQTDEDELGIKYADVDAYLRGEEVADDVKPKIEKAKTASEHKRKMPPKFGIDF